jgi:hypothetical protein
VPARRAFARPGTRSERHEAVGVRRPAASG